MKFAMSDPCSHRPDRLLIEQAATAALPTPHGPSFNAWVRDACDLTRTPIAHVSELRKNGHQGQIANVILLEQDADVARATCSEQRTNAVDDEGICTAADVLRPFYDVSVGSAGFVSCALPPRLDSDARAMAAAARRLWYHARRPNVLIQIPATPAGIKVVFRLIPEAVNIHVTHITSHDVYRRVAEAYIAGLRHRAELGLPVRGIASFATLPAFVAAAAADAYGEMFSEAAFSDLRRLGARGQMLLREPLHERRACWPHVVLPRSENGHARAGAPGAAASCSREPA